MLPQRFFQRAAQQMRGAPVRSIIQRRANSSGTNSSGQNFPWAVDNEFNRERAAVRHHAASTSGAYSLVWLSLLLEALC